MSTVRGEGQSCFNWQMGSKPFSFDYRTRMKILVGLMTGCALLFNLQWTRVFFAHHPIYIDRAAPLTQRLDALRDVLPRQGTVRYVSDEISYGFEQYGLAPLVVVGEIGFGYAHPPGPLDWRVVDSHDPARPLEAPANMVLVKDCQNGLRLYRPREP